jgi:hypothetical protein
MAQRGAYAHRNRGHQARQLTLLSQAGTDWERMVAAFDGTRAALRLLRKRRPPLGAPAGAHDVTADAIARDVAEYLVNLNRRISRGEFDAEKPEEVAA